jgi:hypothetical protein
MENLSWKPVKEITPIHKSLLEKVEHESGVSAIIEHIEKGNITLFEVFADEKLIAIFGNRVDSLYDGRKELVHLFTVTNDITQPIWLIVGMAEEIIAMKAGLMAIRLHTNNRAAGRIMQKRLGYTEIETVWRKEIGGNVGKSE